jgi:hypothetical protein
MLGDAGLSRHPAIVLLMTAALLAGCRPAIGGEQEAATLLQVDRGSAEMSARDGYIDSGADRRPEGLRE